MSIEHINNGGFHGDAAGWTLAGGAAYLAGDGKYARGAASLGVGASLAQAFAVPVSREYMLELFTKGNGATGTITVTITDADGATVYTSSALLVTSAAAWGSAFSAGPFSTTRVGLPVGQYTITIAYNDAACYVDDVSVAFVIKSRAELAAIVADLLGALATADAGYATTAAGADTEGDYTDAVDAGLRAIGAVDDGGRPDVRRLDADNVDAAIDEIQRYMLHKLHRYYSRHATDFTLGERTEHLNQRIGAIERLLGIAVGGRAAASGRSIQTRRLLHTRP